MTRKFGDDVQVRVNWHYGRGTWHHAKVREVLTNGKIVIQKPAYWSFPTQYDPKDVRKPRVRKTTGKVRGRGAPGGWVLP